MPNFPLLYNLRPYLLVLSPEMRHGGPNGWSSSLLVTAPQHNATQRDLSLTGCSARLPLISFYGWRHRNSWLIWMTYPRISAWIYWYKNELNSYLKSTFSPATQQKQMIFFKNVSFEIKSEKSCQVFNSKVFPAHSLQCLNLNNSMSRVSIGPSDPLFTDHLF